MKLPEFEYRSPATLSEVIALLVAADGEAKLLSGGQSLMPMLAFRMATPTVLVDLRKVEGLDAIEINGDVRLGARVRWCDIEKDQRLATAHPLLQEAVRHIAHYQIRNSGTVGGSLAHADPAAEFPALAVACGAVISTVAANGSRTVAAEDFFLGPLVTVLEPDEIITGITFPAWKAGRRFGFQEFARRRGDFAIAGAIVHYDIDAGGRMADVHVGAFGLGDTPIRLQVAESLLDGQQPTAELFERVATAATEDVEIQDDIHADAEYRRSLLGTMLMRALQSSSRSGD